MPRQLWPIQRTPYEMPYAPPGGGYRDGQKYKGGTIKILPGPIAANANTTIPHNNRRVATEVAVKDAGTGYTPKVSRAGAWDTAQVIVQFDTAVAAGQNLVVLIR